jgi:hypothetical protein
MPSDLNLIKKAADGNQATRSVSRETERKRKEKEGERRESWGGGSSHREKDTEAGRNGRRRAEIHTETKKIRAKGQRRHKEGNEIKTQLCTRAPK